MGYRVQGTCFIPPEEFWAFASKYIPSNPLGEWKPNDKSVRIDENGDLQFEFIINTECHPSQEVGGISWQYNGDNK